MKKTAALIATISALAGGAAAGTVLYSPLDSLDGWSVRTVGASRADVSDLPDKARCVELTSSRGTVLLSRELPIEQLRGAKVTVSCSVKAERIVRGPQVSSTGKLHLAVRKNDGGIDHHYARFVGTADWHQEAFTADIPDDANRIVLNVGMESCFGRALLRRLVVQSDRRGVHQLDLAPAANGDHEQLKIAAFPKKTVTWKDVPFRILDEAETDGLDCFRLKGVDHPDWPAGASAPIAVNAGASAVYILHAAPGGRPQSDSPTVIWSAKFVGGHTASFSVFEGRDIGPVGGAEDLENWTVAWRGKDEAGKAVTFGVTKWTIYSEMPLLSLTCRAYHGAAPVVLAVTVVEEPPAPEPEGGEFDDMGGGFQ